MKELDFDELDKAVNTLMAKAPVTASERPTSANPAQNNVAVNQPAPPVDKPVEPTVNVPARPSEPSSTQSSNTQSPVAPPKRSGRFMDVVHPSSDMRTPLPSRPRGGLSLSPLNDDITPDPTDTSPLPDPKVEESADKPAPEPTETAWPDPIDTMPALSQPTPSTTENPTPPLLPVTGSLPAAEKMPEESPFLPDAKTKVEKRPLGGAITTDEIKQDEPTVTTLKVGELAGTDTPGTTPIPAEFKSDILAIEADGRNKHEEKTADSVPAAEVSVTPEPTPAGPQSIAQQYKEQPSTGDAHHTAIYDSASAQPLTHPAKKKSGWMVVMWITLLILVGAGAAAALYFFNII